MKWIVNFLIFAVMCVEGNEYCPCANCDCGASKEHPCQCGVGGRKCVPKNQFCPCKNCDCGATKEHPCQCGIGGRKCVPKKPYCPCANCDCGASQEHPCQCGVGGRECTPKSCCEACGEGRECECKEDGCGCGYGTNDGTVDGYIPSIAYYNPLNYSSEWFPSEGPAFTPFVADPRQVCYAVGWRWNDRVLVKNVIPVSFGDTIPMYKWRNVGPYGGDFEIDLEADVWAVFDPLHDSSPLIDADYYIGFPIIYAWNRWSWRLRGYHISTHLGDEFLLDHPGFHRKNPSAEFLDFYGSYCFGDCIRLYAGVGYIVQQDKSFRNSRFFTGCGFEVRAPQYGWADERHNYFAQPFFGLFLRGSRNFRNHIDSSLALGYEFGKLYGLERRLRLFLEYHDGYSVDGQFAHKATNYLSVRLTYGW